MTATATADVHAKDPRRPVPPAKPQKTCSWLIRPFDLPTGDRMGFFTIREGKRRDCYRAVLEYMDDLSQTWAVSKEQGDGGFADPYQVTLPAPGASGQRYCTCEGARWKGYCRHRSALAVLLAQLLS